MGRPRRFEEEMTKLMVRLPGPQYIALKTISEEDGVPIAEQIRRGISLWLESRPTKRSKR